AFSFLTASILTPKRRLTLCILPLESREGLPGLVLGLLGRIQRHVKGIAYVAFDNGFQDEELMEGLLERKIPFILPLRDTTKLRRWVSYAKRFTYRTQGTEVDVVEAVDRRGWQYFLATNLPHSPKRVLRCYKRRWGIETSYRKINEFLPKTTSRSWTVRIFYFVLACLIYNAWVVLNVREKVTTIAIKLNYIWHIFELYQMEIGMRGG
ncbi:MAG: transposase, partial [Thermoproteota archaeon]